MAKNITSKINVDTKLYPLEAIYGAAYVFVDRAYIFLDSPEKDTVAVSLKPKDGLSGRKAAGLAGEFQNELLNYALRLNLAKYNKKIREYIIERALYASVQSDEENSDSEFDDPLGIAVPWEEKYGQPENKKEPSPKKYKAVKKKSPKSIKKSKK
ncbi:MAG: His-Xaa-Ser system protein HxsD [Planctomycetes bacterium]|jgi:His-Xaa-Ser system protein HxsD|nr:His-Xaa-Ser system protein HxsD [Planctomycetota bacterium]